MALTERISSSWAVTGLIIGGIVLLKREGSEVEVCGATLGGVCLSRYQLSALHPTNMSLLDIPSCVLRSYDIEYRALTGVGSVNG